MKQKILALLTVLAVLACCAVPAFAFDRAAVIDLYEYADVSVNGFDKVVTISFPDEYVAIDLTTGNWQDLYGQRGNFSTFNVGSDLWGANLFIAPLGEYYRPYTAQAYDGASLDISDIPPGSTFSFDIVIRGEKGQELSAEFNNPLIITGYLDPDDNYKLYKPLHNNVQIEKIAPSEWRMTAEITIENTEDYFVPEFKVGISNMSPGTWYFAMDECSITTSISALQELEKNTGRTNELLEDIKDKIDGITDYQPDPTTPGGGIGEELDDAEDQLMDGAQQGLQDFTAHTQSFLAWLTGSATAFVAAGTLLGVILDVQIYNDLLYASLILGSFALFLGAAITIFNRRE